MIQRPPWTAHACLFAPRQQEDEDVRVYAQYVGCDPDHVDADNCHLQAFARWLREATVDAVVHEDDDYQDVVDDVVELYSPDERQTLMVDITDASAPAEVVTGSRGMIDYIASPSEIDWAGRRYAIYEIECRI